MKNLSKALALALLLVPVVAQARPWCSGENEHIWTYASGQTPFSYLCPNGSWTTQAQAWAWAQGKCQQGWDNFADSYADDTGFDTVVYFTEDDDSNVCRWMYRCRACVYGHLPIILARPARLGPAEAGIAATGAVKGQVLTIELHGAGGDEPYYLVDVVTDTEQVQVEVDATTGRAQVVVQDEEGSCRP